MEAPCPSSCRSPVTGAHLAWIRPDCRSFADPASPSFDRIWSTPPAPRASIARAPASGTPPPHVVGAPAALDAFTEPPARVASAGGPPHQRLQPLGLLQRQARPRSPQAGLPVHLPEPITRPAPEATR